VQNGLFPTAPSQARIAISIELLQFYQCLFERSCDAINALSRALQAFYVHRGYVLTNIFVRIVNRIFLKFYSSLFQGETLRDGLRRSLANAVQWYDNLRLRVEDQLDVAIKTAAQALASKKSIDSKPSAISRSVEAATTPPAIGDPSIHQSKTTPYTNADISHENGSLRPGECAHLLRQRCPACFGGGLYGRSLPS